MANYMAPHPNQASFFDVAFFTRESTTLFEKVIADVRLFDLSMINESVAHIEAEMKSSVVIWDEAELYKQLARCQKDFADRRSIKPKKAIKSTRKPPRHLLRTIWRRL